MSTKKFYLVLDVETANSTDDALVYDLGLAVCDRLGRVYETRSILISDIFLQERELMATAYYSRKIPQYLEALARGEHEVLNFYQARQYVLGLFERYNIAAVAAYNANFDRNALNVTERWLTKSKFRYFFPYGTEFICIWHMACQLICTQSRYIKFCFANGLESASGNIKTSAETVYAYMTKCPDYEECHTGLQDVLIEVQIFAKCLAQHKKFDSSINRLCWKIPQKKAKEMRTQN